MEESRGNLKIRGYESSDGGSYNKILIEGSGNMGGDVDCTGLKIYGSGNFRGNLKTEGDINVKGHSRIEGNLKAKTVCIEGYTKVGSDMFVDEAAVTGNIQVDGDFNAEIFTLNGGFRVGGMLNVDILKMNLEWPCKVHEINGGEIEIKKSEKPSFKFKRLASLFGHSASHEGLVVDTIEGDDIYVEDTMAKVVRGNNVELGPGCKIELVEYSKNLKKHEKVDVSAIKNI